MYQKRLDAPAQVILEEALEKYKATDPELFNLLYGNQAKYSTKGGKLVIDRIAKALNVKTATVKRRLQVLREILGEPT